MTARQYRSHLEVLDTHAARLLKSVPDELDEETRRETTRRLREIRAQINPLQIALRTHIDGDDSRSE
ncbi:hypothetical protein GS429_14825 [Natronorubrum sp. JWXQ-INN-674]|uniref:Uncharacterized protein n=1 Tax=Natronorubrum halalkaliphilum TaxID=2691917 RepID=A0A6B0VQP3_9EURY|nr:hypothetical protein [Natronorubrum halalkaliphilum]